MSDEKLLELCVKALDIATKAWQKQRESLGPLQTNNSHDVAKIAISILAAEALRQMKQERDSKCSKKEL